MAAPPPPGPFAVRRRRSEVPVAWAAMPDDERARRVDPERNPSEDRQKKPDEKVDADEPEPFDEVDEQGLESFPASDPPAH
jgi:hypothetical protein